jgi:hypothetical protein
MLNSLLKALQARFVKLPVVVLAAVFCSVSINAHAEALKPYKDRLFRYKKVTETLYDGDFIVVEYIKQRDLHGRDQIPERQVYGNYVSYNRNAAAAAANSRRTAGPSPTWGRASGRAAPRRSSSIFMVRAETAFRA